MLVDGLHALGVAHVVGHGAIKLLLTDAMLFEHGQLPRLALHVACIAVLCHGHGQVVVVENVLHLRGTEVVGGDGGLAPHDGQQQGHDRQQ